jgi:hypothetical protein
MNWLYHESSGFGERPIAMRRVGSIHGPRTVLRGAAGRTLKVGRSRRPAILDHPGRKRVGYDGLCLLSANPEAFRIQVNRRDRASRLAVAHEIGHLLFGLRNHARQGIMRARWQWRDLENRDGALLFTPDH